MKLGCLQFIVPVMLLTKSIIAKWGTTCPRECKCEEIMLSISPMARWLIGDGNNPYDPTLHRLKDGPARSASCSLLHTTATQMFKKIPGNTQLLSLTQADNTGQVNLREKHLRNVPDLLGLQVLGFNTTTPKRIGIASDTFKSQRKLQYLFLQNVNLSDVQPSPFQHLVAIKFLRLVQNGLTSLSNDIFHGLRNIEEISLELNSLQALPKDIFAEVPNLRRLYLNRNYLHCFENCTGNWPLSNLELLDVSDNNITQISSLTFLPMPKLITAELKHNPIQVIFPYSFQVPNNIQHLSVGHKKQSIHIMPFSFIGLPLLQSLHLPNVDNNVLEYGMFAGLKNLHYLNIHGKIQQITGNAFYGAQSLLHLSVRDCRLRRIARSAFLGLIQLEVLDLSHNRIAKLHPSVLGPLRSLRELELQYNQLQELPRRVFSKLRKLRALRLESNPWNCTCGMAKWKEGIVGRVRKSNRMCSKKESPQQPDATCIDQETKYVRDPRLIPTCDTPQKFNGQIVFDVVKTHLTCFSKPAGKVKMAQKTSIE